MLLVAIDDLRAKTGRASRVPGRAQVLGLKEKSWHGPPLRDAFDSFTGRRPVPRRMPAPASGPTFRQSKQWGLRRRRAGTGQRLDAIQLVARQADFAVAVQPGHRANQVFLGTVVPLQVARIDQ